MRKGVKELVAEAEAEIETLAPEAARALLDDEDAQFVDLRDIREVKREGRIPGSFHCPRGMLEFWLDPESPYFHDAFTPGKRFVFYCNKGWRSALATQTASRMGLAPVCHIAGGFTAWKQADYPTED